MWPNWLDYLIYRIFRMRWNRIFASNQKMAVTFIVAMASWVEESWGVELLNPRFRNKKNAKEEIADE